MRKINLFMKSDWRRLRESEGSKYRYVSSTRAPKRGWNWIFNGRINF